MLSMGTQDISHDLWDTILRKHWAYCDTEESMVKLENRKELEECLKEYVCIVQHDRKFFLPDTSKILKNSIRSMDDFSAQNAIMAFESISQYAHNLLTKPWRKEFRILKMYCGFYQHEIKSNLLGAEKLFEDMGYRRISEDILVLDGPICPDQVSNVCLDAIIAYVELQVMKYIFTALDAIGLNCSWWDIYRHREKYTGSTSDAVKGLIYSIEEKRYRPRPKGLASDNYGYIDVQSSSTYFAPNKQFCHQCQCNVSQQLPHVSKQRSMIQPNGMCCAAEHHLQPIKPSDYLIYSNMNYPTQRHYHQYNNHQRYPDTSDDTSGVPMPHSRSLDHYSEPANHQHHPMLPHRHSFDHQQQGCKAQQHCYQRLQQDKQNFYEVPYDCEDSNSLGGGSSSISYAAIVGNSNAGAVNTGSGVGVAYNVSGNRFPLPLHISNQLSSYDNPQSYNFVGRLQEPTYAHIADKYPFSSDSKLPQNCTMNSSAGSYDTTSHMLHNIKNFQLAKDPALLQTSVTPQQQFEPQCRPSHEPSNHMMDKQYNMNIMDNSLPPPPPLITSCQQQYAAGKSVVSDDKYMYAKPTPRENRKPLENVFNVRTTSYNSRDREDTTDISYDSANDDSFNKLPTQENQRNQQHSPTQFSKNLDGVGSFAYWHDVFTKLERSGDPKDQSEREDFLVQSLGLESLSINNDVSPTQNNLTEKKNVDCAENEKKATSSQYRHQYDQQHNQIESKQKRKTFENSKYSTKNNTNIDISVSSSMKNSTKNQRAVDNNTKKVKSSLKQTNSTCKANNEPIKGQPKLKDNKMLPKTVNNNNNSDSLTNAGNGGSAQRKRSSLGPAENATRQTTSSVGSTSAQTPSPPPPLSHSNQTTEWECSFCTFLNPVTERVCEMCGHSKGFKMDTSSNSSGVTRKTTVAQNTTSCA